MDDISRLRSKIKLNPRYKKFAALVRTERMFDIPFEKYRADIRNLFALRKFRSLDTSKPTFIHDLNTAYVQDLSYRSTMTEMLATATAARIRMTRLLDALEFYLHSKYAQDLKAVGAAKERERFIMSVLRKHYDFLSNVEILISEIDLYIKDIDKSGFGATSMANTQVILSKNGGRESL